MKKSQLINKTKNSKQEIVLLSLITVSAVLRKEKQLRDFLSESKKRKIKASKIYEALLQTYLFAGFPSALNSLAVFKDYFKIDKHKSTEINIKKLKFSGKAACRKIYREKFEKLITNTSAFSPELAEWLVIEGYGKVLSRKGIGLKERELLNVAILTALKYDSQLYSHINGAYNNGANINEIKMIIETLEIFNKAISSFGMRILNKFLAQKSL